MGYQRVKTGQPVNSRQGRVNVGQTCYFTLYLAGGSSIGTLNDLKKKELSGGSSSPTRQFLEISKNTNLME